MKIRNILKKITINILLANAALVIFYPNAFLSLSNYIFPFLYSVTICFSYWESFTIVRKILDKYIPFDRFLIWRYVTDIVIMMSVALINILIITYLFHTYIWNNEFSLENSFESIKYTVITFSVTFPFVYSIVFMKLWKKKNDETDLLKKKQLDLEYESLKSQMNPHFLFNSLNSLVALIEQDKDKSIEFVKKLSLVYRYILDTKHLDIISIDEEIDFVKSYISLQKIRFGENLIFSNHLPDDIYGDVLPLSIQLMVENAIKHNIVSQKRKLKITLNKENDFIVIENNVQPKDQDTKGRGIGLNNIKELYKKKTNKEVLIQQTNSYYRVYIPIIFIDI